MQAALPGNPGTGPQRAGPHEAISVNSRYLIRSGINGRIAFPGTEAGFVA
jgi:hypothetical protein